MMDEYIAIVDYGMGNIRSVAAALARLGARSVIAADEAAIAGAAGCIIPGVGAFPQAMRNLRERGLVEPLSRVVLDGGMPVLGICLGMQLMATRSDEMERTDGLGWIEGTVEVLEPEGALAVPHVGWNDVNVVREEPLYARLGDGRHFYFDHTYHFCCDDEFVSGYCDYGGKVVASLQRGNIFAVQFHPEKSQRSGLVMLRNFLNHVQAWREATEGR